MDINFIITASIVALCTYLFGSISFAVIVARKYNVNILKEGSGNPGATNVKRVIGKKAGNIVFILDFLKGSLATCVPLLILDSLALAIIALIFAVLGHSFSAFLKFRGGKGVATTMGGLLILVPVSLLIGMILWLLLFKMTRIVSLASLAFASSLPISTFFIHGLATRFYFTLLITLFIIFMHRNNISRLLKGQEGRFSK